MSINPIEQISGGQRKAVAALAKARNRRETGLFAAEGTKCVLDTLDAFSLHLLAATPAWLEEHPEVAARPGCVRASRADLERMTALSTAPDVIAVYAIPEQPELRIAPDELVVALDCVQDPGNLGTIVRAADWMGVHTVLASRDTVDIFGAKAVQATMGAISRVAVHYCDLPATLAALDPAVPVYGTFLGGENIYTTAGLGPGGVLVMGNEGRGVSDAVARTCTRRLTIPSWPPGSPTSESLNVGVATAIALAAFRSRLF